MHNAHSGLFSAGPSRRAVLAGALAGAAGAAAGAIMPAGVARAQVPGPGRSPASKATVVGATQRSVAWLRDVPPGPRAARRLTAPPAHS